MKTKQDVIQIRNNKLLIIIVVNIAMKYFDTKVYKFVICGLLYPMITHAFSPNLEAKKVVEKAYQQIDLIVQNPGNATVAGNAKQNFSKLFPTKDLFLPDEFKYMKFGITEGSGLRTMNYLKELDTFVQEKKEFSFEHFILSAEEIEVKNDFSSKDLDVRFVRVLVKKKYAYSNSRGNYSFTDTVVVGIEKMNIVMFTNEASSKIGAQIGNVLNSIETMKYQAEMLYRQEKYRDCYNLLKEIVSKANDGDSYYRLAAIVYNRKARKAIGIAEWREQVMQYLLKAVEYGEGNISRKAHNWINWLS